MARNKNENRAWENSMNCSQVSRSAIKVRETPKHVAEIGGWSLRQVQRWCADGTLPAKRIGGTWAISGPKLCELLGIDDKGTDMRKVAGYFVGTIDGEPIIGHIDGTVANV